MYCIVAISALTILFYIWRWHFFQDKDDRDLLKGKRVLITGASQNIGEQFAYYYSKRKARVFLTSRNEEKLQEVAKNCTLHGAVEVQTIAFDMARWEEGANDLIRSVVEKMEGIDILVLNHVNGRHLNWDDSEENVQYMKDSITINYHSCVALATAALPTLQQSKGHILVISSGAGKGGMPHMSAYGASKAALANFFESLSFELGSAKSNYHDVSITVAIFGAIATNNTRWGKHTKLKGYPMEKAVQDSVLAGVQRQHTVYCPKWIKWLGVAKMISPTTVNYVMNLLFKVR